MFACRLGKDLGLTLEQVFEMTTVEFRTWIAFYNWEHKEMKKATQRSK
jgi:hypothetical protein